MLFLFGFSSFFHYPFVFIQSFFFVSFNRNYVASIPVEFIFFHIGKPFLFQTTANGTLISHEKMTIYFFRFQFFCVSLLMPLFLISPTSFPLAVLLFYPLLCARSMNITTHYKFNGKKLRRLCEFNFAYFHSSTSAHSFCFR